MTKQERSWILYDVANSAFVLVMVTAIMPIFFKDYAAASLPAAESTAYWGFANSTASLALALMAPFLGSIADFKQQKKAYFLAFLAIGLLFTSSLIFVGQDQWLLCLSLFIVARIGWAGANIFYDAFITDVTSKERMDSISAKGYGYGYIGSVIPFVIIIALLLSGNIEGGLPIVHTKIAFAIVVLWWFVLAIPAIKNLQQVNYSQSNQQAVGSGFSRLYKTLTEIRKHRQVFVFLLAYFFYIDGVGTIISMSTAYGRDLGFELPLLIAVLLFIQILAFPFALLYGRLAQRFSAKRMLLVGIGVYIFITLLAWSLPAVSSYTVKIWLFWLMAFLVASSMGGIQALSRSYFSKLIPPEKSSEFFGFYNVFGKFAAILGPFIMGIVAKATGDSRWGVLSILILFVVGGAILSRMKEDHL